MSFGVANEIEKPVPQQPRANLGLYSYERRPFNPGPATERSGPVALRLAHLQHGKGRTLGRSAAARETPDCPPKCSHHLQRRGRANSHSN